MTDDISKYKYEEISNKVLRADKRLFDDGAKERGIDTNPHSVKGKISSKDFGSGLRKDSNILKDNEELKKTIQSSIDAFQGDISAKQNKNKSSSKSILKKSQKTASLLDNTNIQSLEYFPTNKTTLEIYSQIVSWCSSKFENDLPEDVINSLTDLTIEILRADMANSLSKKQKLEEVIDRKLDDEEFQKILSLANQLTDYKIENTDINNDNELGIVDESDDDDLQDNESEDEDIQEVVDEEDVEIDILSTVNQEVDNPDDIIKLSTSQDENEDKLNIKDIDKYWITKQLAKFQTHVDAYRHAEMATQIIDLLDQLITEKINLKSFERHLSSITDFEINTLYYNIMRNYKTIYYGIKLASVESEDEKAEILEKMTSHSTKRPIEPENNEEPSQKRFKPINSEKVEDSTAVKYPRNIDINNLIFTQGSKLMTVSKFELPKGSFKRTRKSWEEIHIPPPDKPSHNDEDELVEISSLPGWIRPVFPSTEMSTLNRIQSKVFPSAFEDDCNILMCAPTGAGKTNVAMLTVLRTMSKYRSPEGKINLRKFKIVYIAPLKALVQEQVREFDRRLSQFGIKVEELTGDSNLTKHQIEETQILVTTPEKWDVITRKNNDASYINLVKLVIIDEIHLLHDERGPVLENIVARTMKNMEYNSESIVRFVGLSATLPNYRDVAQFLAVENKGLFYFGPEFRPCPLAQEFVGITEKKAFKKYEAMNEVCYEKVIQNINEGHQMIIFVHSRKETAKTAKWIANKLVEDEKLNSLMKFSKGVRAILQNEADNAKSKSLKQVLPMGFGIHHAGLNKEERSVVEDLFAEGHIKVLVSTATLAWGVNLPAHTVIIKGTSVYSPEKGTWVDLSPQDILQMLGRAGRPRYDTHGDGIIITSQDQIKYYLAVLNQQLPIESQMYSKLADSINAEIVAGSIKSLKDCVEWLGYTYLYTRMLHSREIYFVGPQYDNDSELIERRRDLGYSALVILARNGLIKYNYLKDVIVSTALGKIASHYYISYTNMKKFDLSLKPTFDEIELFRMFALSEEFKYITVRKEEKNELQHLIEKAPIPINESVEDPLAKINVLLQAYITGLRLDGFALMADMIFVSQSAGRLFRALYDLALHKKWARVAKVLLNICKMIENHIWLTNSPLRQFPSVPNDIINVAEKSLTPWKYYLALKSEQSVVKAFKAEKYGNLAWELVQKFPKLSLDYSLAPISPSLLQVELKIVPFWKWDIAVHGYIESFTLIVEDCDGEKIIYSDRVSIKREYMNEELHLNFVVPILENEQPNYFISIISEKWIYCEVRKPIMLTKLITPKKFPPATPLFESTLVPTSELGIKEFVSVFPFDYFNKFQSQAFDSIYQSDGNILFATSKGNGKTIVALMAILRHWANEGGRAIYVNPSQKVVDGLLRKWKKTLSHLAGGKSIAKFTGDITIDLQILMKSHLVLCTPEQIESISKRWQQRKSVQSIELIIADDFHMIGSGYQGALYEIALNRFKYFEINLEKNIRYVLLGSSVASYKDLADWIGIEKGFIFDFDPRERVFPVEVKFEHVDIAHNPSLLQCLIRPLFDHVQKMDKRTGNVNCIAFVSQRSELHDILKELIRKLKLNNRTWLKTDIGALKPYMSKIEDKTLKSALEFGIGLLNEHMPLIEQNIVVNLFEAGALTCLLATKNTAVWSPSATDVLVLGTKEYEGAEHGYLDYSINDILEIVGLSRKTETTMGKVVIFSNSSKLDYYKRFLVMSLPFESHLHIFIADAMIGDIKLIKNRQYAVDWLTYSLFYRKLQLNPSFYGLKDTSEDTISEYLSELVENSLSLLAKEKLIDLNIADDNTIDEELVEVTPLNSCIISNYYNIHFSSMVIVEKLDAGETLKSIVENLCWTSEFDNVPIRDHDERSLFKLYNSAPWKWTRELDFNTRALKVFVLLQAHFSRFGLTPDLRSDLNQILPKFLSLLYAAVDVLSSRAQLSAMLAMDLCQMIVQGVWSTSNVLRQVPHFTQEILERCKEHKVETVYDIMELEDDIRDKILNGLDEKEVSDVAAFVNKYPNLEVDYKIIGDVIAGEGGKLEIEITRDEEVEDLSIVSSVYPIKKLENWWILMGNTKDKELYAIKKMALSKESQVVTLDFTIPEAGKQDIHIWCICDSYLDADKQLVIENLDVVEKQQD
ncbi:hypothetical protein CANINC_004603 [Pichia inconspicua]|uniref:RNA helicase n=1 Tax=Pichia inconspicua TaxID=52247 RepID=A0A4T0WVQ4_9ASCO|nr:hypothetical protein CANINC_004603 [[Candida] inconspicua]